jgi:hypothetical protein
VLGLLACSAFRTYFSENYESIWTVSRTRWRGIGPTQGFYLHRMTQHRKTRTHIHASSGIRSHDPSVRAAEDNTCLRPLGHWNRHHCHHWHNFHHRSYKLFGMFQLKKLRTSFYYICTRVCVCVCFSQK